MVRAAPLVLVKVVVCVVEVLITCLSSSMKACGIVIVGATNVLMIPLFLSTVRTWLSNISEIYRFPFVGETATARTVKNVALVAGPPSPL